GWLGEEAGRDPENEADGTVGRKIAVRDPCWHVPAVAGVQLEVLPAAAGSDPDAEGAIEDVAALIAAAGLPVTALPGIQVGDPARQVLGAREQAKRYRTRAASLEPPAPVARADDADAVLCRIRQFGRD